MTDNSSKILIGEIIAAHGIRGEVKITSHTENPEHITHYGSITDDAGKPVTLKIRSAKGRYIIAAIEGVTDRNAAESLLGTKLYLAADALPEAKPGEYYYRDLVGLEVRNIAGKKAGIIKAMHDFGHGDILEIQFNSGATELVLFKQAVREVNLADGYIVVEMPDVMLVRDDG